jgi:hypothetical protein
MNELVALSADLRTAVSGMAAENAAIAESIRRLASVSRDGRNAALGLRQLLETKTGA